MTLWILAVGAAGAAALGVAWRMARLPERSLERLDRHVRHTDAPRRRHVLVTPFPPHYRWLPPLLGAAALGGMILALPLPFAVGGAALAAAIAHTVDEAVVAARRARIEQQLANALDLMVASIQAGGALMPTLESVLEEARAPLRPFLRDVVTRLQLGDAPDVVLKDFAARIPLEPFRLFAITVSVHWEVGGSLTGPLATVARTVRDRAELSRRINTQGAEARFSVAAVLVLSYAVAFLMWQTSPERVTRFLASPVGAELGGAVIALQAVGLFWMSRLSQVEY